MTSSWTGPAGVMARAVQDAVAAAAAHHAEAFAESLRALTKLDREQLGTLLGTMVQSVLEQRHPDGLDADDVDELVETTLRSAASWYPAIGRDQVVRVVVGALGVSEIDDEERRVDPTAVLAHGLLLLADMTAGTKRGVTPLLDHGLRELHRAQTQEMP